MSQCRQNLFHFLNFQPEWFQGCQNYFCNYLQLKDKSIPEINVANLGIATLLNLAGYLTSTPDIRVS